MSVLPTTAALLDVDSRERPRSSRAAGRTGEEAVTRVHSRASSHRAVIAETLTPHQRRVLAALALNGVPIDVLAERLKRPAPLYTKTLHDARDELRRRLGERGLTTA